MFRPIGDDLMPEVSLYRYARMRGVARSTILHAISSGLITSTPRSTIDVEQADAEWLQQHLARMPGSGSASHEAKQKQPPTRIAQGKMPAGVADVQLAKHRLAQLEQAYFARNDGVVAVTTMCSTFLEAFAALPDEEAATVALDLACEEADAHRLLVRFVAMIREDLGNLSGDALRTIETL